MTNQPFGQPPAFGAPVQPSTATAPPVEEPTRSNKTLLIAVAAGVVALGVLGGATALVLSGEDGATDDLALPASSAAPVEPSIAPTTAASAPLPTVAVKGRNVFVPLVEPDAAAAAGAEVVDPVAAAVASAPPAPTSAPPAPTSSPPAPTSAPTAAATSGSGTGSTGGSFVPGSGGGSVVVPAPAPAPTVTVTQVATAVATEVVTKVVTEVVQDEQLVAKLRGQIATLEQKLLKAPDGPAEEIERLEAEIAQLKKDLDEANGTPAYDATVRLLSVDPDEDGEVLNLEVNGKPVTLDLVETEGEPGDAYPDSTPLYRTGTGQVVRLRYVDYVAADKVVTFLIGSEEYEAVLGTTLVYSRR